MARCFRLVSPDGLAWEEYALVGKATATVTRYERDHGEAASRVWTKRMTKNAANEQGIRLRDQHHWRLEKL